ncbi:MAG: hypothetical protein GEU90_16770 [Gemmatimonas sp.]|nr:hypothetical protein [Gemmatimonas sp.]
MTWHVLMAGVLVLASPTGDPDPRLPSWLFDRVLPFSRSIEKTAACVESPVRATADPYALPMMATVQHGGAYGSARLTFGDSPFGVTVNAAGNHLYDLRVETSGLPKPPGVEHIVWVATPDLDQVTKLGVLDDEGRALGQVTYNKMLVFVTAERSTDLDRWSGPILLRGISASGLMHTMAGHGPFLGMPC